jgi:hypothetical protein
MALSLALSALLAAPAFALDTGDIVVESVKGEVRITMNGAERSVRAGGVLELPATIDTGRDGAVELRQGATTVSVGPETRLEFPALETRGGPVDRIVQPHGNAFYNIGKRAGRRLRVETPYLVGVIKGTQFNVASQPDATTISLFEGALEIHASDDSSVIDLKAGEIASRKRDGTAISVIRMEGDKSPTAPRAPAAPAGGSGGTAAPGVSGPAPATLGDAVLVDRGESAGSIDVGPASIDVAANTNVNLGPPVETGALTTDAAVAVDVNAGSGAVDVGANLAVDSGPGDAGAAVNVNLGAGAVDATVGANVAVDAGPLNVDTDAAAAVDVGAGNVAANVDVSAGANVGNVVGVDTDAATSVDLGTNIDVAANVDVGANVGGVNAGVAAGVDVGAGSVDLGVNLGGVDLNVGVDLDRDDGNNGHGNDSDHTDSSNPGHGGGHTPAPAAPVVDVGELLDGILKRHRKK